MRLPPCLRMGPTADFQLRRLGLILWIGLFLALAMGSSVWGQARINGQVRLPSGETKSPDVVRVSLLTVDGGYVKSLTLSAESSFILDRVPNGQYWLTVESPGFESGRQWIDINAPWSKFEIMVIVELGPRIDSQDPPEPQPDTGRETVRLASLKIPPKAWKEYRAAEQALQKKQVSAAVDHLKKAITVFPDFSQAYALLGQTWATQGRTQPAIEAYEKAVALDTDDARTRRNLAQLYLSLERYQEAVTLLTTASTIDPSSSRTWALLGEAHLGLRDCGTALDYFQAAVDLDPRNRSFLGFGQCYLQAGRTAEALAEFRQFLAANPNDPRAPSVRQLMGQIEKQSTSLP